MLTNFIKWIRATLYFPCYPRDKIEDNKSTIRLKERFEELSSKTKEEKGWEK